MRPKFPNRLQRRDLLRTAAGTITLGPVVSTSGDVVEVLRRNGLSARDLGARFDGRSDDAAALQRAVDEAARQKRPLVLPSGTARLGAPIDLKGRNVALIGDPTGHTVLRAAGPLRCLLDAEDGREVIDSPLYLYGLTLDGGGMAVAGIRLRYRHRTVFDTIAVGGCETGVDEIDSWLGRRINCRTRATGTGWRLRGANHSSVWVGCSFIDARDVHLDIGAGGTAKDGNNALLFQACDVEFGAGEGVRVAAGATATFDTCYIGEAIGGDVLVSAGTVLVRGGALFVGHRPDRVGIRPVGGTVTVADASVHGQRFGTLDRVAGVIGAAIGTSGKVVFRDVGMHVKLGGDPHLDGDVLGTMPMRVFASTFGRNWRATAESATIDDDAIGDARRVRCRQVAGASPVIGLAAPLTGTRDARTSGPAYLVIVYSATKPVELKATSGPISRAPWRFIGTLPASRGVATYVKADVPVEFARYSSIELIMRADVGDELTLHHATVGDESVLEPWPMANLAKAR